VPRYEAGRGSWFFEIERDGLVVRTCKGDATKHRRSERTYIDDDTARYEYQRTLRRSTWDLRLAGRSQILDVKEQPEPVGSAILVDEYFAAADDRFLDEVVRLRQGGKLAALAERWYADPRPWARKMLLAYVLDGCDRPEHKGLVKRLYKQAEAASDDEAVAHFMVAFDQMTKHLFVTTAEGYDAEIKANPELDKNFRKDDPKSLRFSRATRQYLERRAYRYFRRKAYREPAAYVRGILLALPHYRDEALVTPAQLLDAWGLVNALYGGNDIDVLQRDARGIGLAYGASLADLVPMPRWPDEWKNPSHAGAMFAVLVTGQSRTVRAWLARWLRAHHASHLAALSYAQVKSLLVSPHDEVQVLGGELFAKLEGLEKLTIAEWLELLAIENLDVVTQVASVVEKHVSPARLTLEQAIALACARTAPVARLGLAWARGKKIESDADLVAISKITRAGVATVRDEGTQWATSVVTSHPAAKPEHLRDLADAPHADARAHALVAVAETPKLATPTLWFALTESPYPDVRDVVIDNAKKWREEAPPKTLRHVWTSAMLSVHRGAAAKQRVPRQIAERIASHPAEAEELLPILRVALRSVRPAERGAALAALARALTSNGELRALAQRLVPELVVTELVSA
jgi:hypothetical protein